MARGQMLVFVHGPSGSGKTATARLLVSEKNLDVFSGTTRTDYENRFISVENTNYKLFAAYWKEC